MTHPRVIWADNKKYIYSLPLPSPEDLGEGADVLDILTWTGVDVVTNIGTGGLMR